MRKISTQKTMELWGKKLIVFSGLLVILLFISSSIAIAEGDFQNPRLASDNPDFAQYKGNETPVKPELLLNGHINGLTPESVNLSYLSSISIPTVSALASYDLRALNKVTSMKDQSDAEVCWTFASYASLESYLMPEENWDFSENNMKNLLSSAYSEGFDRGASEGGNRLQATAYLTRWSGPVQESDDPYLPSSGVSPENLSLKKHVQKVLFLPDKNGSLDNEVIKWAVQNYGAVYTTLYYDDTFYSPTNYSFYYNGSLAPNHGVAIVGWNDSFDKNKFSQVPPGNGAFIVKNSWGEAWGENGYFYISYYDSQVGTSNAVFTAESPDNYKSIYQYDPLGWTDSLGYTTENPTTAWGANIFTSKSDELLKAVSFYTTDSNCSYEIYVYTNPTSGPINQTGPVFSKSGSTSVAGYYTIPLESDIRLTAGQNFSVVLNLTNLEYEYPIAIEEPLSGNGGSSKAVANSGESFISSNGGTWEDITTDFPNTNVCIKAFTDPYVPVFPGYTNPPTDSDHDDLYEDINGNGKVDFDDVVAYYANMNWIGKNATVALFDYNNNDLIDFDDIVKLYNLL